MADTRKYKYGKYKGKSIDWVKSADPSYYRWSLDKPNLISKPIEEPKFEPKSTALQPNLNFWNEPRDPNSQK